MKKIPIPDEKSFMLQVIQKVEDFIKKIRLKAIFFMKFGNQTKPTIHKTGFMFGLNSTNQGSTYLFEVLSWKLILSQPYVGVVGMSEGH